MRGIKKGLRKGRRRRGIKWARRGEEEERERGGDG